ncbi:hypothetical protein PanWU01x14_035160, partial [Parasponia andersonii]
VKSVKKLYTKELSSRLLYRKQTQEGQDSPTKRTSDTIVRPLYLNSGISTFNCLKI